MKSLLNIFALFLFTGILQSHEPAAPATKRSGMKVLAYANTVKPDWTNHDRSVNGLPGFHVLLRVDESTYTPVRDYFQTRGGKPMGADHPIAWTNEPASGGRFFYTEFGHDLRSLSTAFARQHVLEGIKWAAAAGKPLSKPEK